MLNLLLIIGIWTVQKHCRWWMYGCMTEEWLGKWIREWKGECKNWLYADFSPQDSFKTTQHWNITTDTIDEQMNHLLHQNIQWLVFNICFFIVFISNVLYMSRKTVIFTVFIDVKCRELPPTTILRMSEVVREHWRYISLMVSLIFILKKENLKWVPALLDRSTAVDQCYKLGIFQKKKKITCMFPSRQLKTLTAVLIFITVKLGVLILFHSNYLQTSFSLVFLLKGHFTQIPKEEKGFSHTSSGIWPCRLELLSIK